MTLSRTELISATQAAARAYTYVRAVCPQDAPECRRAHAAYKEAQRQEIGAAKVWQPDLEAPVRLLTREEKERAGTWQKHQPRVVKAHKMITPPSVAKRPKEQKTGLDPIACGHCGQDFAPKNRQMIYCSIQCRQRSKDARYAAKPGAAAALAKPPAPRLHVLMCETCRRAFESCKHPTRFCSNACRSAATRARRKAGQKDEGQKGDAAQ